MKYSVNLKEQKTKIKPIFVVFLLVFIISLFFLNLFIKKGNRPEKKVVKNKKTMIVDKIIADSSLKTVSKEKLIINSIKIERNSNSKVFFKIEGKINYYKVGEIVNDYQIVEIHRDFVVLEDSLNNKKRVYKE